MFKTNFITRNLDAQKWDKVDRTYHSRSSSYNCGNYYINIENKLDGSFDTVILKKGQQWPIERFTFRESDSFESFERAIINIVCKDQASELI